jgi:FKBP-type peptidyl-prolyl cis-trans isomerase
MPRSPKGVTMRYRLRGATLLLVCALTGAPAAQTAPTAPPDVASPPADSMKTPTGLSTKLLESGKSDRKTLQTDLVTVHYTLWSADGKTIDSTRIKNTPARFPLVNVIPGWQECVMLMTIGEKRRCWIPQSLAYNGQKGRPAGMLVVDVELVDARLSPTLPPPDVAKAPDDAVVTPSGLASKVLQEGIGARKPYSSSRVTVEYTGWTTDGKMFDSSVMRGTPTTFRLDEVIKGWTEGVQLMVEGEKRRFWIPESLAYEKGGGPRGLLVFDIVLISIER